MNLLALKPHPQMTHPQDPSKLFTLYGLRRPDDKIIRYIGITCRSLTRRLREHKRPDDSRKSRWVSKMAPLVPEIIPYAVGLSLEEACELEISMIGAFREKFDLTNLTEGGEGHLGFFGTPEICEKRRVRMVGNKYALGHRHSSETREQMGDSHRGHTVSFETREKIGAANRGNTTWLGRKHTEETKKLIGKSNSVALLGTKATPEARENMCIAQQKRRAKEKQNE